MPTQCACYTISMKFTKHEHAYMTLEEQGHKLVIDPGTLTKDLGDISNVVAVVITHSHFDHMSAAHLAAIAAQNPAAVFYSTSKVAGKVSSPQITVVAAGQTVQAGPFKLEFFGEKHAFIHGTTPDEPNFGVLINDNFYYPGDSLTLPELPVKTLAVPLSGPWLRINEVVDFMLAVKPKLSVPAHDALLTATGEKLSEDWLTRYAPEYGGRYQHVAVGESLEI